MVGQTGLPGQAVLVTDPLPDWHLRLLEMQAGVLTRQQALAAGLTQKAIVARLRSERWQRLHAGVYATFSGPPPRPAVLWAAVLRAGPQAVLSHETAAGLYGLLDDPGPVIHLTVPSGSPIRRPAGAVVHYSRQLDQTRHPVLAPPRTRVEDCVLDLAATASCLDEAVSVIVRAVGRRRTTAAHIGVALARRPKMRWRTDITGALALAGDGVHSLLEYRYVTRVERPHGLPRGNRQRAVVRAGRRQYQDVSYDDYLLVVELDGQLAHPLEASWRDARRDNLNAAAGLATIRLGYVDVSEHACASAAVVSRALQLRGWPGAARPCTPVCGLPHPQFAFLPL
jgi:Transcriptional regulator, AbiEi antitoxin